MIDGTLYFRADDGTNGSELWRSQGTAATTEMVVNLEAGSGSSGPRNILASGAFGRGIGFTAFTTTGGTELYTTTGAVGNFDLVDQIEAGSGSSSPHEFHYSGLATIFSAQTAAAGFEPWMIIDVAGSYITTSLGNLNPGAAHSLPKEFTPAVGRDFLHRRRRRLRPRALDDRRQPGDHRPPEGHLPGVGGSEPAELLAFDGRLFFRACDATAGCELWTSDGTLGGTQRFKDILPGTGSGNPQHLVVVGDDLYFSACDEAFGCELWVSDGSAARTRRLADIAPGPASSNPKQKSRRASSTRSSPSAAASSSRPPTAPAASSGRCRSSCSTTASRATTPRPGR